ncbi:assimilatory nitrate reductase (NADH) alpha subunit apoprotein [Marininema mesophilum]|uniref:Assimilatory nitrate reductase (NADH) alpha subunit apoprotein n=1 Tax=Marininema mesophilum TaxID=1048340 RepID=A0A1H2S1V0_9BACL|nr:assimilatory nitrate reductase (NADH) alpha subunit apoprotein [Marininema mesophilum]
MEDFLRNHRNREQSQPTEHTALSRCPYCSMQCTMWVHEEKSVQGKKRVSISPNEEDPVVKGRLCVKGMNAHTHVLGEDRLKKPLLRKEGQLEPVTWAEALTWFKERVIATQEKYGHDAVAMFGGGSLTNEESYLLGKFARVALRTRYIDYNGRYCMSSAATAANQAFGVDRGLTQPLADLPQTDCLILAGTNISECQPTMMPYIHEAKKNGATIIVIDPRETATSRVADIHLQVHPGGDSALVNGMLKVIVDEGYTDENFIRNHTRGFNDLKAYLQTISLSEVASIAGVSEENIRVAARAFGKARAGMVLTARGVEQHTNGVRNVRNFINIALATGNMGRVGSGYGAVTGQGNGQGGREHGQKADQLPGYRQIENQQHRREVAEVWGIEEEQLPRAGVSAHEMFARMHEQLIRGLVVFSSNPLNSNPDSHYVEEALEQLDFLVVVDMFLSETASKADLVLPSATFLEDEGTVTNLEGRVSLRRAVRKLPAEVKTDWMILMEMAQALNQAKYFSYSNVEDIFNELCRASKGGIADYNGMSYQRIDEEDGVFWPCPDKDEAGVKRLFTGGRFFHPDGRARFLTVPHETPAEATDDTYPLTLTTGRLMHHYLTGVQTRRTPIHNQRAPEPLLYIHPNTAEEWMVEEGQLASVKSRRGEIKLKVKRTTQIRPDTVFIPMHWGGDGGVNRLTLPELDPESKMPAFKACAVRVGPPRTRRQKEDYREGEKGRMKKKKLVLVGNGMAGVQVIEHVLKLAKDDYDVTIFGKEPYPNYNRILLSSVLSGETEMEDITLNDWDWYQKNDIQLHVNCEVTRIDTEQKVVYGTDGVTASYDQLILATGSLPFMLPLPGVDKKGVIAFRDIKDCEAMMEASKQTKKAAVIGGGLLGLEAARGLLNLGMEVDVVHIYEDLMERQLDPVASTMLKEKLEQQGMNFLTNKHTEKILGNQRVKGLRFKDGTQIQADLVVMAVGSRNQAQCGGGERGWDRGEPGYRC